MEALPIQLLLPARPPGTDGLDPVVTKSANSSVIWLCGEVILREGPEWKSSKSSPSAKSELGAGVENEDDGRCVGFTEGGGTKGDGVVDFGGGGLNAGGGARAKRDGADAAGGFDDEAEDDMIAVNVGRFWADLGRPEADWANTGGVYGALGGAVWAKTGGTYAALGGAGAGATGGDPNASSKKAKSPREFEEDGG